MNPLLPALASAVLLAPVTAAPSEQATSAPAAGWSMRPLWSRFVFGGAPGAVGLEVADLDGDGRAEMVAGSVTAGSGAPNAWIVVRASPVDKGVLEVDFRSPSSAPELRAVRVANVDGDPTPEVVTATETGVQVHDGATLQLQQAFPTTASSPVRSMSVADSDGDGVLDYVVCSETTLSVYDLTGALAWSLPAPCVDLAVGQVDDDPAPEIVIGDGNYPGYVIDGQTHAVQWTSSFGFGHFVRLADVDGDGRQEVVAGFYADAIRVFDAELYSLKSSVSTPDLRALKVVDLEGDGPLEVLYGDGQWGGVHVLDAATLQEKWQIANPASGVIEVAAGDPDGDGVRDLVWAGGGPARLFTAPITRQSIRWQSPSVDGPFFGLAVAPAVGTARRAVLAGSYTTENGSDPGLISYHYPGTGRSFHESTVGGFTGRLRRVQAAQLDDDAQSEVLLGASLLTCLDSLTHEVQWQASLPSGLGVGSLRLADVDRDGALEALVGVEVLHSGAPGVFVYAFDAATGALEWQSPTVGSRSLFWLRVAQLDRDPQPEIVVANGDGQVYVLDRVLSSVVPLGAQGATALETFDTDGQGPAELFVGTADGAVRRLDPRTGVVLATPFTEAGRVDALAIGDLDGDGLADYATASENVVRVRSGVDASLAWTSAPLGAAWAWSTRVGELDSMVLAEVDGRGQPELVVGVGHAGFVVLTSDPPARVRPARPAGWRPGRPADKMGALAAP